MKATEDRKKCHEVLDAAGAPSGKTVVERLEAVARKWLEVTAPGALHSDGCQCHLCVTARRVIQAVRDFEK